MRCCSPLCPHPAFCALMRIFHLHPGGSDGKESACNVGQLGSIPGSGSSLGEGNGNPLQYSYLENPMDRGAWQATVHGVTKSRTQLSNYHTHTFNSASTPARTPPLIFDSLPPSLEESYPGPCLSYYHFPLLPSSIHAPRLVVLNTNHSAQVLCLTAGMRVVCRVCL